MRTTRRGPRTGVEHVVRAPHSRVGIGWFLVAAIAAQGFAGCTSIPTEETHESRHAFHGSTSAQQTGGPATSMGCEVQFVADMITHHEQAIQMSDLAPERASDQRVVDAAAEIIRKQRIEISLMTDWLRAAGVPSTDSAARKEHSQQALDMPGMLTAAQLHALSSAKGRAFDERFLQGMIRHHRGALTMVEQELPTDSSPMVLKFGLDIDLAQRYEIAYMTRLLLELRTGRRPSLAAMARIMATRQFDHPLPMMSLSTCGSSPQNSH